MKKKYSQEFREQTYRPLDGCQEKLASRPVAVKLPEWADQRIREMTPKQRVAFLRKSICESLTQTTISKTSGASGINQETDVSAA